MCLPDVVGANNNSPVQSLTHDLIYKYEGSKPNAASQIGDRQYTYDANGNPILWDTSTSLSDRSTSLSDQEGTHRRMIWDEENRLQTVDDNDVISHYVYDHTGERVVKTSGTTTGVSINGAPMQRLQAQQNTTWYVSPYFTVGKNGKEFTKHYFAGSTRVASKLGVGHFNNKFGAGNFGLTAGTVNYIDRMNQLQGSKLAQQAALPPGPPHVKGIYAEPEYSGIAYEDAGTPVNNYTPAGWPRRPIPIGERSTESGVAPGPPIMYAPYENNDNSQAGSGFYSEAAVERNCYYYHSDHLGSTSYVTLEGKVSQFVVYLPFGETLLEEHSNTRDMPYLFNGKERDSETGLLYYGARYYDPLTARFLNIDPMWKDYPNIGSYVYCHNNPVRLIDPTGMNDGDGLDSNVETSEEYVLPAVKVRPSFWSKVWGGIKSIFKSGGGSFSGSKDSGTGKGEKVPGGIPLTTEGGGASPTKTVAEHPDNPINIDDLLAAVGGAAPGKRIPGMWDPASFMKDINGIIEENKEKNNAVQAPFLPGTTSTNRVTYHIKEPDTLFIYKRGGPWNESSATTFKLRDSVVSNSQYGRDTSFHVERPITNKTPRVYK